MKKLLIYTIFFACLFLWALPGSSSWAAQDVHYLKAQYEAGVKSFQKQDYQEAIKHFEETLRLYPNLAPVHNFLGMAYREMGADWEQVAPHFEQAIQLDPEFSFAYENLAKGYYRQGNFDKAEEYCLKALRYEPSLGTARIALGWIYLLGKSQTSEAIVHFRKVLEDHEAPYAYFGLGLSYFLENERGYVLEMITKLKGTGQDQLAGHLEQMLRENKYIPPPPEGTPLFLTHSYHKAVLLEEPGPQRRIPSASTTNTSVEERYQKYEDMPVKVRAFNNPDVPVDSASPAKSVTGAERIKELQRNTMMLQSGF